MEVCIEFFNGFQIVELRAGRDGTDTHAHDDTEADTYGLFEHDGFSLSCSRITCISFLIPRRGSL
jgi:hypothetical protein